jgi:hypothetical protein
MPLAIANASLPGAEADLKRARDALEVEEDAQEKALRR